MGGKEQGTLERVKRTVIDVIGGKRAQRRERRLVEQADLHEGGGIDEVRITGKGRKALVRGVAKTGRTEWADLPILHLGRRQKIKESIGRCIERPDAVNAR